MNEPWLLAFIPICSVLAAWSTLQFLVGRKRMSVGVLVGFVCVYILWACVVLFGGVVLAQIGPPPAEATTPSASVGLFVGYFGLVIGTPGVVAALALLAGYWILARVSSHARTLAEK